MSDTPAMTPAEFRSIIESIGYSEDDVARTLSKSRSMVQKLKSGTAPVSAGIQAAVEKLQDEYIDALDAVLAAAPAEIQVWRDDDTSWAQTGRPARWHRMIAAAARQECGTRIVYRSAEEPDMPSSLIDETDKAISRALIRARDEAATLRSQGALPIAWDDHPAEVVIDGIHVLIREDTAYLPVDGQKLQSAGKATFLTIRGDRGFDPRAVLNVDLRHTIIGDSGVVVFQDQWRDAALVYVVREEQEQRMMIARRRSRHDAAVRHLRDATDAARKLLGTGADYMLAKNRIRYDARTYYDNGIITKDEAATYLGEHFDS